MKLQELRIDQLKSTQSILQQSKFEQSETFLEFIQGKNVPLYYLSDQNVPYVRNESLNVAFNLYIAKLTEINSYSKDHLMGNLSIQTLEPLKQGAYKPSYYEQSIYFVGQNGNKELRQFAIEAAEMYAREAEDHAEQNIVQTKVTAIVSIVIIVLIGMIIAPILTQAEIRKYKALLYFLKIPKDKLPDLIKNCEYCLNMNEEERYIQIMKDYESFLGIKLVNQQVEQLRQAREEQQNLSNQQSRNESSGYRTSTYGYASTGLDRNSTATSRGQSQKNNNQLQVSQAQAVIEDDRIDGSAMESMSSMDENAGARRQRKKPMMTEVVEQEDEEGLHNENEADNEIDRKEETINRNQFNLGKLNLKENRRHDKKISQKEIDQIQNAKTNEQLEIEKSESQELNNKIKMINSQAYKRRSTMIFSSLSLILVISTYFVIAYFLAMNTFQTAADVIVELQSIFYKGSCFDSTINFLRVSQIRNESMVIKSPRGTTGIKSQQLKSASLAADEYYATDYYLEFCFEKEDTYNRMRVNPPKFFNQALPYINSMESSTMCDTIYVEQFAYLKPMCKVALNGILSKGLTNSFYFMFTQILKANLQFLDLGVNGKRNKTFLEGALRDETMVQIIDVKANVLDPALNLLKQKCMDSVIAYIQKLLNDFVTAFIVFTALLTIFVTVFVMMGFRILRKSMWDTNIILKIIPFESLPKEDRIEIKNFFKT